MIKPARASYRRRNIQRIEPRKIDQDNLTLSPREEEAYRKFMKRHGAITGLY